ncbi:MAG: histidinol-phosphate transaminase [Gammaproteobacteria bacterium]
MGRQRAFDSLAAPGVRGLRPYMPGKSTEELERQYGIAESIKLASNENPMGPAPAAIAAVRGELSDLALYPDGSGFRLKAALASRFGVEPERVTLGNGSNEILVLLAETFLEPGLEAVYDEHAFAVYRLVVQATGAEGRVARSQSSAQAQPRGHDVEAIRALITSRTRLIFIANPNNPTGTWLTHDELFEFVRGVPGNVIVVVDEAYSEYVTRDDYPQTIGWLDEFPNLVITRTFSKIYGLAGLRVGYALSDPDIAELLNRVRAPFNVNSLALTAALAALGDEAFVAEARRMNAAELVVLSSGLRELGFEVTPSIGNFLLVGLGRPAGPVYEALLQRGIIVRPVANYGLPNHLRITVGLPEQNQLVLRALSQLVKAGCLDD